MVKKENKLSWNMLMAFGFLLVLYQGFTGLTHQSTFQMFLIVLFVLAAFYGNIVELRRKVMLDRRREAAVQSELQQLPLRPVPEAAALPLPTRMQYLPASSQWSLYLYLSSACILILEIIFVVNALNPGDKFRDLHIQMAIILPIMGFALWIGTFLYRSTQRLYITEEGLTKRTLISKTTIRWKDAHLFAIHARTYTTTTLWGTFDGIWELASNKKIIHWTIPQLSAPGLLLRKTSFETYQQQMRGLLATIATQTRLKCYDLNG